MPGRGRPTCSRSLTLADGERHPAYADCDEGHVADDVWEVDELIGRRGNGQYYLVRWRGYGEDHDTWEPRGHILDKDLIKIYDASDKSA